MPLIRRVCAAVTIGVLLRDYDFQRYPPDSESDCSDWLLANRETCIAKIGEVLASKLPSKSDDALSQAYYCQLLRSLLRVYSRAIDLLPDAVVALYRSVRLDERINRQELQSATNSTAFCCSQTIAEFLERLPQLLDVLSTSTESLSVLVGLCLLT